MSEHDLTVRPERLAAAARALQRSLLELVALRADEVAQVLAHGFGMVPWDREQVLGRVQKNLQALRERRFTGLGGDPVRIIERRAQPLECIAAAWEQLRQGRRVAVEAEPGATHAGLLVLAEVAQTLGEQWLAVAAPGRPLIDPMSAWGECGVVRARTRVAVVHADADAELAAYVLARACLRRTGFDPRAVHRAVIAGPSAALERHLRRLWVGARMGAASDDSAFAGPVSEADARRFEDGLVRLSALEGLQTLVPGDRLEHPAADGVCLAPALFAAADEVEDHPIEGPVLVLHRCEPGQVEATLEQHAPAGHARIHLGKAPRHLILGPEDRRYEGALLIERIPPGLPQPRP